MKNVKKDMPPVKIDAYLASLKDEGLRRLLGYMLWEMENMKKKIEDLKVAANKSEITIRDVNARTHGFERYS